MNSRCLKIVGFLLCLVFYVSGAFGLTGGDVVKMKKAGVAEEVIQKIISSKALTRALITVDEIIEMKQASVGDEVILALIEQGNAPAPESDQEDAEDRAVVREIKRQEVILSLQKKEVDLLVYYLSRLVTNPEVVRLVDQGKIGSEDYASIVKYLKQYARDEDTLEYGDDGNILIGIDQMRTK